MRSDNEFRSLLAKINVQKEQYAQRELFVSNELEHKIQINTEKKKKNDVYSIVTLAVLIVILGYIYDLLTIINEKWIISIAVIVMAIIMLFFLVKAIIYKCILSRLNKEKSKEDITKEEIRTKIKALNDEISTLVLSVIVLNEHFYELSEINDPNEREKKWKEYIFYKNVAINKQYQYFPTTEDYLNYYKEYKQMRETNH